MAQTKPFHKKAPEIRHKVLSKDVILFLNSSYQLQIRSSENELLYLLTAPETLRLTNMLHDEYRGIAEEARQQAPKDHRERDAALELAMKRYQ